MLVCKAVEVLQDFLSEYVDKKFTRVEMLIPGYLDTRVPCGLPRSDPGPVKPATAICPVTAIAFVKALTARVATYRLNCWPHQKARSSPCVNSLLIIIAHAAR